VSIVDLLVTTADSMAGKLEKLAILTSAAGFSNISSRRGTVVPLVR
jgi:hypothetical protein